MGIDLVVNSGIERDSSVVKILEPLLIIDVCESRVIEEKITRVRLADGSGWTSLSFDGQVYLDTVRSKSCPIDSCGHDMQFMSWAPGGHDGTYRMGWNCDRCKRKVNFIGSYLISYQIQASLLHFL